MIMNGVTNGAYNHVGEIGRVRCERQCEEAVFIYINRAEVDGSKIGR